MNTSVANPVLRRKKTILAERFCEESSAQPAGEAAYRDITDP